MSFREEIKNIQDSEVNANLEKYTNMLMDAIRKEAKNGGNSVYLHNLSGFSVGGSVARVNLFEARRLICKEEGFRMTESYLGKAYSHMANGDLYRFGIAWDL